MNSIREQFYLSPEITYLNHGSFGACPKPIMEAHQRWQRTLEEEPVQFIVKRFYDALTISKKCFAEIVGCAPEDFFFLQNPTTAVNQVVKSLDLKPGDEVLTTDHEYGALDKTFDFYAKKKGFVNRRQKISLPL